MKLSLYIMLAVVCPFNFTHGAPADERDDRIQSLEKRVEQLEKLLQAREAKQASPGESLKIAEPPKPGPSLSVGASGFSLRSADTNFTLRIRGLLQSPHAAPLTVEQMDEAVSKHLRGKHAPSQAGRKSAGR